jgi:Ca2+:H+ antiporter
MPAIIPEKLADNVLRISRITSVILIVSYTVYVWFNMRTHHSIYNNLFLKDETRDELQATSLERDRLTLTECVIALFLGIGLVSFIAVHLVERIPFIVEACGVSETFVGLILIPLVEKFAEHLTALDEAWDDSMNLAMSHILGSTVQTAIFNTPLVVLAGWASGKQMNLDFELFNIILVILSIIVVGNFLRDQKSNYLEGVLCVSVYSIIAVAAFYFPTTPMDRNPGLEFS